MTDMVWKSLFNAIVQRMERAGRRMSLKSMEAGYLQFGLTPDKTAAYQCKHHRDGLDVALAFDYPSAADNRSASNAWRQRFSKEIQVGHLRVDVLDNNCYLTAAIPFHDGDDVAQAADKAVERLLWLMTRCEAADEEILEI